MMIKQVSGASWLGGLLLQGGLPCQGEKGEKTQLKMAQMHAQNQRGFPALVTLPGVDEGGVSVKEGGEQLQAALPALDALLHIEGVLQYG